MTSTVRLTSPVRLLARVARAGLAAGVYTMLVALGTPLAAQQLGAQNSAPPAAAPAPQAEREVKADTPDATRAELTTLLEQVQVRASDASLRPGDRTQAQNDVAAIRRRLEFGDFQAGDRFHLTFVADSVRRAELIVREGADVEFGALPPLSLKGVLRSELQTAIVRHLSRFYRAPEVRVQLLTRLLISGSVTRPGSYAMPPDIPLSDAMMAAGGPLPSANPDKIVVMRGGREIINETGFRRAVKDGQTIDQAGLQPGDEIRVPDRPRRNWTQFATFGLMGVSVFTAVLALVRSSYSD